MESVNEDKLDKVVYTAVCNLYTLGKENQTVCFKNFSFKNTSHRALLSIGNIVHNVFGYSLKINISKFKLFFYKMKYREAKPFVASKEDGIDVNDFILHIEKAYNEPGIFVLIYSNYYKRKKEKK